MKSAEYDEEVRDLIDHEHIYSTNKMTVMKTKLKIRSADHVHPDFQGKEWTLCLEKRRHYGRQSLEFSLEWLELERVKCNQGHWHITGKELRHGHTFSVAWEHVQEIIEWIELGPRGSR